MKKVTQIGVLGIVIGLSGCGSKEPATDANASSAAAASSAVPAGQPPRIAPGGPRGATK